MNPINRTILKVLVLLALLALSVYTFWLVRFTLTYLLISAVIALIGKPVVDLLTGEIIPRIKLNRSLAAAITLILIVSVFSGLISLFLPSLLSELKVLGKINFESIFDEIQLEIRQLQSFFIPEREVRPQDDSLLRPGLADILNLDSISDTFAGLLGSLGNLVFALFSILFITFFFLREKYLFRNIVLAIIPDRLESRILHVAPDLRNTLGRYFAGILLQVTIITTLVSLGLKFMGFNNTIVIGFFAGIINVIPYLGPIIGMSFGLLLGLAQSYTVGDPDLLRSASLIIIVFGVVQMVDNFVLQPIIFSRSIRAHPLEIFIVISFAAALGGIAGMIVAVPVYSVLRLLAAEFFPNVKFVRWLTQSNLGDEDIPT